MPGKHFFPRAQDKFVSWSVVFNNYIAAHAQELNLTPQRVADYNQKHTAMMVAVAIMQNPGSRGPSRTKTKNNAIAAVRQAARRLAGTIRSTPGVTAGQRAEMGLALRGPGGRHPRSQRPRTTPTVRIKALSGDRLEVQLRDQETSSCARPRGVGNAVLRLYVGDHPPADISEWKWAGQASRTKHIMQLPKHAKAGMILWVTACWESTRHESGPYAQPVHTMVPLGMGGIAARIGYQPKGTAQAA